MTNFWNEVSDELWRIQHRTWYFMRTGRLHPECKPPWEQIEEHFASQRLAAQRAIGRDRPPQEDDNVAQR